MDVTIRRVKGKDYSVDKTALSSNMRDDASYTGKLLGKIRVGAPVYIAVDESIFCTGIVVNKKNRIFRTINALYEINY
jgi:hypothetical protein